MITKMKKRKSADGIRLQQDIISADTLHGKNELLTALFNYSIKLLNISFSENFYVIVANELKRAFGAFGVTISTYNTENSALVLQYATFSDNQRSKAMKLIGRNLKGMRFKVSKDIYAAMTKEWVRTVSSLNEVSFGAISPVMGKILEKTFGLEWFSGICLQDNQTFIGTAVIFGKKGAQPPSNEELKGFSGVTAVALSRWVNEQRALLTEMKYKSLAENMKDVLWQSDYSARIIYISPSGFQILGYNPEELLNRSFTEIISLESYDSISNAVRQRQRQAGKNQRMESITYEVEVIHRNGTRFWAEIVMNPIYDPLGNITGFQGVARDIAERKAAEIKIRQQYEKLEQMNAEKDKFFSIIAHDLKGALHGFLGYSKYIADRIHDLSIDKLEEYSKTIRTIALNLNELLENLLEWSMMQRERVSYSPGNHNLNAILENCLRFIEQQARNKEITIIRKISPDINLFVDYQMITSIIRNLVSNAVKFTRRSGLVEITSGDNHDHVVEIMIRDNGVGMDSETLNKLFRIDSVMPTPGTEGESSTGLGLIICSEYISKHNGKIWVESEVNKGTCVHFTVPRGERESLKI
jgi:PAS domain S-box-containing protein